jgi:hypothetical protein
MEATEYHVSGLSAMGIVTSWAVVEEAVAASGEEV